MEATATSPNKVAPRLCAFKAAPEVNEMQRLVSGMVTTNDLDMQGEVLLPEGCDYDTYFWQGGKGTKSVDLDHDPGQLLGTCVNLKVHAGKGIWTLTHIDNTTPLQQDVFKMIVFGTIRGLSIQANPSSIYSRRPTPEELDDYGMGCQNVWAKWMLTAYAFTARPCNPKCLVEGIKSPRYQKEQEDIWEEMRDLVDARQIRVTSAVAAGLPMRMLRRVEATRVKNMRPFVLSGGAAPMVVA